MRLIKLPGKLGIEADHFEIQDIKPVFLYQCDNLSYVPYGIWFYQEQTALLHLFT